MAVFISHTQERKPSRAGPGVSTPQCCAVTISKLVLVLEFLAVNQRSFRKT